jgi:DNA invertase Pin-like site-specific DNA recombinase
VVVWKRDRLSRSLKDLLHIMDRMAHAEAGFRSLTEAIDTTSPAGRMLMQMVGSCQVFAPCRRIFIGAKSAPKRTLARGIFPIIGSMIRKSPCPARSAP